MSYTKTNWENGATPAINADNLNHMEQGIADAHDGLTSLSGDISDLADTIDTKVNSLIATKTITKSKNIKNTTFEFYFTPLEGYTPISVVGDYTGNASDGTSNVNLLKSAQIIKRSDAPSEAYRWLIKVDAPTVNYDLTVSGTFIIYHIKTSAI